MLNMIWNVLKVKIPQQTEDGLQNRKRNEIVYDSGYISTRSVTIMSIQHILGNIRMISAEVDSL